MLFVSFGSGLASKFFNLKPTDDNGVEVLARDVFSAFIENLKQVVEKKVQKRSDISWKFKLPWEWKTSGENFVREIVSEVRCGLVLKHMFEILRTVNWEIFA